MAEQRRARRRTMEDQLANIRVQLGPRASAPARKTAGITRSAIPEGVLLYFEDFFEDESRSWTFLDAN
jgi:hypothetical protein